MARFLQAIEFKTSRIAEIEALVRDRRDQLGGSLVHGTITACRDRPGTYLTIVEFASAETATENSRHPENSELVARMVEFCDAPPTFYNLDPETRAESPRNRSRPAIPDQRTTVPPPRR